jgi:type IV fimbrial biogenesis protein FimT
VKSQHGFNLIEAMVTVSVLAILMAVAVPNVVDWMRRTQARTLAESINNGLQKARMEAVRRNKVITFWLVSPAGSTVLDDHCTLSSASGSWVISVEDPTSKCGTAPSPTVSPMIVERYHAGSAAPLLVVSGLASDAATAASSISFNGTGQPVTAAARLATVDITHTLTGARRLRVALSSTGSIRMCDRDVQAPDARACP